MFTVSRGHGGQVDNNTTETTETTVTRIQCGVRTQGETSDHSLSFDCDPQKLNNRAKVVMFGGFLLLLIYLFIVV